VIEPHQGLIRYPLFAVLAPDWLADWIASGETHEIQPGQTLFCVGSTGTHVYLVLSGKVRVFRAAQGREINVCSLRPGEVFGEYALLPPGLNTATCRAAEVGQVLRLPLDPLRERVTQLLQGRSRLKNWLRLHYIVAHLRDHPCLGFMSANSFLPLLEHFGSIRFAAGDTMQTVGLHDDRWFVMHTGRAVIGTAEQARELGAGDCFGEAALLDGVGLPTVRALSAVDCQAISRAILDGSRPAPTVSLQTAVPAHAVAARCHEWLAQKEDNDCGVAALAMVALAHGRRVSVELMRQQIGVQPQGASLQELQRAAGQLGFRAEAVRIGLSHLSAVRLPAICHLAGGHYVVLFELVLGGVIVGDPASGVGQWSSSTLQRSWSGQLLLVTDTSGWKN
jgi:CRP-like cAMP-binding protein